MGKLPNASWLWSFALCAVIGSFKQNIFRSDFWRLGRGFRIKGSFWNFPVGTVFVYAHGTGSRYYFPASNGTI